MFAAAGTFTGVKNPEIERWRLQIFEHILRSRSTGWSLAGLSAISRVPANKYFDNKVDPVDFDSDDRFSLNGQRMILYAGTYGQTGSEYRLEQNQSVKIIYSNDCFIVKTGDGLTSEYGNTIDSRVAGNSTNTLSWHLNKITNNYNQVINISYIAAAGYAYPQQITYGTSRIEFLL